MRFLLQLYPRPLVKSQFLQICEGESSGKTLHILRSLFDYKILDDQHLFWEVKNYEVK